jgi:hypothetical protein
MPRAMTSKRMTPRFSTQISPKSSLPFSPVRSPAIKRDGVNTQFLQHMRCAPRFGFAILFVADQQQGRYWGKVLLDFISILHPHQIGGDDGLHIRRAAPVEVIAFDAGVNWESSGSGSTTSKWPVIKIGSSPPWDASPAASAARGIGHKPPDICRRNTSHPSLHSANNHRSASRRGGLRPGVLRGRR